MENIEFKLGDQVVLITGSVPMGIKEIIIDNTDKNNSEAICLWMDMSDRKILEKRIPFYLLEFY